MSGGSGYVLSSEALRQFVHGLNDSSKCRQQDDSAEDLEAGACLFNLNVPAGDSRDSKLRYRFFPLAPYSQLLSHYTGLDFWFFKYAFYNSRAVCSALNRDWQLVLHSCPNCPYSAGIVYPITRWPFITSTQTTSTSSITLATRTICTDESLSWSNCRPR